MYGCGSNVVDVIFRTKALPRAGEKGYFEPQDLANLHDEILEAVDSEWSDCRPFPFERLDASQVEDYTQRIACAFQQNYGDAALCVLKEPRMCRMLDLWDIIFQKLDVDPVFCFISFKI